MRGSFAMLSKNEVAVRSLRSIKAKIIEAKTSSGAAGEVSEEEEIKILQRMVKQRKDSVDIFRQQNREDLASKEVEEIEVIEKFLPKQMDEGEVRILVKEAISSTGASTPQDMGKVMGALMPKTKGNADGSLVSRIVREELGA